MGLAGKVNPLFWEMDTFERNIRNARSHFAPRLEAELKRLKYEVNRLLWDASQVDEIIRTARFRTNVYEQHNATVNRRIHLLKNEIGFAKSQQTFFTNLEKNPQTGSSIFSSPSNSGGSSPEGAGYSNCWFGTPQPSQASGGNFTPRFGSQNVSQPSNQSGFSGSGHYPSSGRESRSSQGSASMMQSQNSQMYFGWPQNSGYGQRR